MSETVSKIIGLNVLSLEYGFDINPGGCSSVGLHLEGGLTFVIEGAAASRLKPLESSPKALFESAIDGVHICLSKNATAVRLSNKHDVVTFGFTGEADISVF